MNTNILIASTIERGLRKADKRFGESQLAITFGNRDVRTKDDPLAAERACRELMDPILKIIGALYHTKQVFFHGIVEGPCNKGSIYAHQHGLIRISGWEDRSKFSFTGHITKFLREVLPIHFNADICFELKGVAQDKPLASWIRYCTKNYSHHKHVVKLQSSPVLPDEVLTEAPKYRCAEKVTPTILIYEAVNAVENEDWRKLQSSYKRWVLEVRKAKARKKQLKLDKESLKKPKTVKVAPVTRPVIVEIDSIDLAVDRIVQREAEQVARETKRGVGKVRKAKDRRSKIRMNRRMRQKRIETPRITKQDLERIGVARRQRNVESRLYRVSAYQNWLATRVQLE